MSPWDGFLALLADLFNGAGCRFFEAKEVARSHFSPGQESSFQFRHANDAATRDLNDSASLHPPPVNVTEICGDSDSAVPVCNQIANRDAAHGCRGVFVRPCPCCCRLDAILPLYLYEAVGNGFKSSL